jgi:hypothetical protein
MIRENRGAPVAPAAAAQLAVQERNRPQMVTAVKPVAVEPGGRMTLAPREKTAASSGARPSPRVEPVAPVRGRPMSTAQQPIASAPVSSAGGRNAAPQQTDGQRENVPNRGGQPTTQPPGRNEQAPPDLRGRPTPIPAPERGKNPPPNFEQTPAMRARPSREEDRRYVATPAPRPSPSDGQQPDASRTPDLQRQREREREQELERQQQQELQRRQQQTQSQREAQSPQELERERARRTPPNAERDRDSNGQSQPAPLVGRTQAPPRDNPQAESRRQPTAQRTKPKGPEKRGTPRDREPEPTKKPKSDDNR